MTAQKPPKINSDFWSVMEPIKIFIFSQKKTVEICHENSYGSDFNLKCGEIAELSNAENSGCQADNT